MDIVEFLQKFWKINYMILLLKKVIVLHRYEKN